MRQQPCLARFSEADEVLLCFSEAFSVHFSAGPGSSFLICAQVVLLNDPPLWFELSCFAQFQR